MKEEFNLLNEPWIPCIGLDGKQKMMNLLDTLIEAHKIQEIQADIPPITASLYLMILAIVNAIIKPENDDEWEETWLREKFPKEKISGYAEKWYQRFDLFDPSFPFYQDPKIGKRKQDLEKLKHGQELTTKGISDLVLHVASGSNPTLFDHSMDKRGKTYSIAEAAQLLIMIQAYSLGGLTSASISSDKYYKDSAFSRGILFLSTGKNLFETILLNLIANDFDSKQWKGPDIPAWERNDSFDRTDFIPGGISDLLTWQSRRILLIKEGQKVINCYVAPGIGLPDTFTNPFYHNRFDKTGTEIKVKFMRLMNERALWRDSGALLDVRTKNADVPTTIKWFDHLRATKIIKNNNIKLNLFGICNEPGNKKAYFYAQETFQAPARYIEDAMLLDELNAALDWAEDIGKTVYFSANELAGYKLSPTKDAGEGKKPDPHAVTNLVNHLDIEAYYWSQIEPAFYELLVGLPNNGNAKSVWQEKLKQAARKSLMEASNAIGSDAAGLKALAKAENKLEYGLSKLPELSKEI